MTSLAETAGRVAFAAARDDGIDRRDARRQQDDARRRIAQNADDEIKAAFTHADKRRRHAEREADRLRIERDVLLCTLATALGTTLNAAWHIARLDIDRDERIGDRG
jgi:hypothetical protein